MTDVKKYADWIVKHVQELADEERSSTITAETPLVGDEAALKSRDLVELLLSIEEYAEDELGVEFDWASDSAMSERRSMFRTPQTLATYLDTLVAAKG